MMAHVTDEDNLVLVLVVFGLVPHLSHPTGIQISVKLG